MHKLLWQIGVLLASLTVAVGGVSSQEPATLWLTDQDAELAPAAVTTEPRDSDGHYRPASFQEPTPRAIPRTQPAETVTPAAAADLSIAPFGSGLLGPTLLTSERRAFAVGAGVDVVMGFESTPRSTTDAGNLLGKSPSQVGLGVQNRNPIVTDPRIRGSRVGRLAGSGSYWVPARLDLDTMLSKIDSRILEDVVTVKGPYAARYGPGFSHLDFQLLDSPRYDDGVHAYGSTSLDWQSNGQQWYGRQMFWGGATDWGVRGGYGHRTGNDYAAGQGVEIPSSYNSREVDLAVGHDISADSQVEFHFLHLDQTGVELPGQAFDIDWLGTNGYEVEYRLRNQPAFDCLELTAWYNRTRFDGDAQRAGKRRQFPIYDLMNFVGATDVDSTSTGLRLTTSWGDAESDRLALGVDLRAIQQEVNEITSGRFLANFWRDANSPIPQSESLNPGVFVEYATPRTEDWRFTAGGRGDFTAVRVTDDPAKLASLGTESTPANPISLADILGTTDLDRDFTLWALYVTGAYDLNAAWTAEAALGYAERAPCLTELYAAQTFMFVLQNGVNTVTGDPQLSRERLLQCDLALKYDGGALRARIGGFHAWAWDYITFENMGVAPDPSDGSIAQEQLKYVNTDLATFVGGEAWGEYDLGRQWTTFATVSYVDGRDRTRNGSFATQQASPGSPSTRVAGLPRGWFSGISGAADESLPSILPLESRVGLRLHSGGERPTWGAELSARMVHGQERVATSLLEVPTPGFTTCDLRGYWRPGDRLLLVAGVENFTDRAYREHLDYISQNQLVQVFRPGISFYTGCQLEY